jgi:hypothetical protein
MSGISNTRCLRCDAGMADAAYLCWTCCETLRDALDLMVDAWPGIDHAASGLARRAPQTGRVGGGGHSDGIPLGALVARDAAQNAVSGYLRLLDDEGRTHVPPAPENPSAWRTGPLAGMCEVLTASLSGLRMAAWAPEAMDELLWASKGVVAAVEPPADPPQRERRIVEADVLAVWVPISRAVEVVGQLRHPAPREVTLRAWAGQTGRVAVLEVVAGKVRIGEVLSVLDERRAKRGLTSGNTRV